MQPAPGSQRRGPREGALSPPGPAVLPAVPPQMSLRSGKSRCRAGRPSSAPLGWPLPVRVVLLPGCRCPEPLAPQPGPRLGRLGVTWTPRSCLCLLWVFVGKGSGQGPCPRGGLGHPSCPPPQATLRELPQPVCAPPSARSVSASACSGPRGLSGFGWVALGPGVRVCPQGGVLETHGFTGLPEGPGQDCGPEACDPGGWQMGAAGRLTDLGAACSASQLPTPKCQPPDACAGRGVAVPGPGTGL